MHRFPALLIKARSLFRKHDLATFVAVPVGMNARLEQAASD
jgi:hypothetical protein